MSVHGEPPQEDEVCRRYEAEFRHILFMIKPSIQKITNPHHIKQYGLWLRKLSDFDEDKFERNKYLLELANQIQEEALSPPFTWNPPSGALPPLQHFKGRQKTQVTISRRNEQQSWPYVKQKPLIGTKKGLPSAKSTRELQNLSCENSWQDLSDAASSSCAGDYSPETEEEEEEEEEVEQEEPEELEEPETEERGAIGPESKFSTSHQIEGLKLHKMFSQKYLKNTVGKNDNREMDALKSRMMDLIEVKNALRESHCVTEDRKRTIRMLEEQLKEARKSNEELKSALDIMTKKTFENDMRKAKAENDFKENFMNLRNKELALTKQRHEETVKKIEEAYKKKAASLKSEREKKIEELQKLTAKQAEELKKKDAEILSLKQDAELKSKELEKTALQGEQVIQLKSCVSKMDKLMHWTETEHAKTVEKLKQELEVRDLTLNMRLQAEKADLLAKHSVIKQEEIRAALNVLEEKYKKMFEVQYMQSFDLNRKNSRTIEDLQQQLKKHEMPCKEVC